MSDKSLTPKQEAFCIAYMDSGNASEAYRSAYNAEKSSSQAIHVAACRVLANAKVALRLDELRKPAAKAAQMTLEGHLNDLKALRDAALGAEQYSAAISAEIARGKASGIHVEKSERVLTGPNGEPIQTVTRIELVSLGDDSTD